MRARSRRDAAVARMRSRRTNCRRCSLSCANSKIWHPRFLFLNKIGPANKRIERHSDIAAGVAVSAGAAADFDLEPVELIAGFRRSARWNAP